MTTRHSFNKGNHEQQYEYQKWSHTYEYSLLTCVVTVVMVKRVLRANGDTWRGACSTSGGKGINHRERDGAEKGVKPHLRPGEYRPVCECAQCCGARRPGEVPVKKRVPRLVQGRGTQWIDRTGNRKGVRKQTLLARYEYQNTPDTGADTAREVLPGDVIGNNQQLLATLDQLNATARDNLLLQYLKKFKQSFAFTGLTLIDLMTMARDGELD